MEIGGSKETGVSVIKHGALEGRSLAPGSTLPN